MNENHQSLLCPSYSERYTLNVSKENLCKVGLGRNVLSVAEIKHYMLKIYFLKFLWDSCLEVLMFE